MAMILLMDCLQGNPELIGGELNRSGENTRQRRSCTHFSLHHGGRPVQRGRGRGWACDTPVSVSCWFQVMAPRIGINSQMRTVCQPGADFSGGSRCEPLAAKTELPGGGGCWSTCSKGDHWGQHRICHIQAGESSTVGGFFRI